jgi:hypothetical protein
MANNLPQAQSSTVDAKQFFDNFFGLSVGYYVFDW